MMMKNQLWLVVGLLALLILCNCVLLCRGDASPWVSTKKVAASDAASQRTTTFVHDRRSTSLHPSSATWMQLMKADLANMTLPGQFIISLFILNLHVCQVNDLQIDFINNFSSLICGPDMVLPGTHDSGTFDLINKLSPDVWPFFLPQQQL